MIQAWQFLRHNRSGYGFFLVLATTVLPIAIHSSAYAADAPIHLAQTTPTPTPTPEPSSEPSPSDPIDPTLDIPESPNPVPPSSTTPAVIEPIAPTPDPAPIPEIDPTLDIPPSPEAEPAPVPSPQPSPQPSPIPTPVPSPVLPSPSAEPPALPAEEGPVYTEPSYEAPYEPPYTEPPYTEPPYSEPVPGTPSYGEPSPSPVPTPAPARPVTPPKSVRQSFQVVPPAEANLYPTSVGRVEPGVLGQADYLIDGRRVRFYEFEGQENQRLIVTLRNSSDGRPNGLRLEPYMLVFGPDRQVIGGTIVPGQYRQPSRDTLAPLDNQVYLRLPETGNYMIAVFAEPGAEGRFGLSVQPDPTIYLYDETRQLVDGTEPSSNSVEINGRAGQTLHIEAMSYAFDPQITLVDEDGNVVAQDDDRGGNFNARIDLVVPETGTYQVIVTPANSGAQGNYRLTVY